MSFFNSQQNPEQLKRNLARYVAGALVLLLLQYIGLDVLSIGFKIYYALFYSVLNLPCKLLNFENNFAYLIALSLAIVFIITVFHYGNKALKTDKLLWFFNPYNKPRKILCLLISTYVSVLPLLSALYKIYYVFNDYGIGTMSLFLSNCFTNGGSTNEPPMFFGLVFMYYFIFCWLLTYGISRFIDYLRGTSIKQ
jgi:hypothetical protein